MQAHPSQSLMLNTRRSLRTATPGPQRRHGGRRWRPWGTSHLRPALPSPPQPGQPRHRGRAADRTGYPAPLSPSPRPPGPRRARLSPGPGRVATAAALSYLPAEHRGCEQLPPLPPRRCPETGGIGFRHREKRPRSVGRSRCHVRETHAVRTPRPPSLLRAAPSAGGRAGAGRAPGAAIFVPGSARMSG